MVWFPIYIKHRCDLSYPCNVLNWSSHAVEIFVPDHWNPRQRTEDHVRTNWTVSEVSPDWDLGTDDDHRTLEQLWNSLPSKAWSAIKYSTSQVEHISKPLLSQWIHAWDIHVNLLSPSLVFSASVIIYSYCLFTWAALWTYFPRLHSHFRFIPLYGH